MSAWLPVKTHKSFEGTKLNLLKRGNSSWISPPRQWLSGPRYTFLFSPPVNGDGSISLIKLASFLFMGKWRRHHLLYNVFIRTHKVWEAKRSLESDKAQARRFGRENLFSLFVTFQKRGRKNSHTGSSTDLARIKTWFRGFLARTVL